MPTADPPLVRLGVDDRDGSRAVSVVAAIALLVNVALVIRGLPGEAFPNVLHRYGLTDPLCGGTRAARLTLMGQWSEAWAYNPVGIVASLSAALWTARTGWGLATGSWLNLHVGWSRRRRLVLVAVAVVAFGLLGIRQQMRADLLLEDAVGAQTPAAPASSGAVDVVRSSTAT